MKKTILIAVVTYFMWNTSTAQNSTAPFNAQLWKNVHIGWDIDRADDYKWNNFAVGTGISRHFISVPDAYWYIMADLNWSKYTLYKDGKFAMGANNAYLKTFSLSVPAYVGYNIYKSPLRSFGVKVYTGPILETIFSAKLDGQPYKEYNPIQFGWTIGTGVKFLYLFGFNVAYRYYPTPIFTNGNLVRSSVNFTLGF